MKKNDGEFVLVGSTLCMKCPNSKEITFFEDGSGGMVRCDKIRGPIVPMRGLKEKPSLTRKCKEEAESAAKGREIREKRKELAQQLRELRKKRTEQSKEMSNEKHKV
jgi:hypothetical protein